MSSPGGKAALAMIAMESAPSALATLDNLLSDKGQPGPVRVAAAKAVIDLALKLNDDVADLDRLDQALDDLRDTAAGQGEED